jgi:hypothetical protein
MKNVIAFLLVAASTLGLLSCASTGSGDFLRRMTSDDCLVVIRTTVDNRGNAPTARQYTFKLSGDYPNIKASNGVDGYMFVRIHEAGVSIIGLSSSISASNVSGASFDIPLDRPLPYKPGEVVVTDFSFAQTLIRNGDKQYTSGFDFPETAEDHKADVLDKIKALDGAKSWFTDPL